MSANEILKEEFIYDDYKYQKENNILIKEKFRAEGLHKVLYKCPNCKTESQMNSKGTVIYCEHCGKKWNLNEDGTLQAIEKIRTFKKSLKRLIEIAKEANLSDDYQIIQGLHFISDGCSVSE